MPLKLTTDEFIKKAILTHGMLYDYSKVNYVNDNTKVIIICKEHGEFLQGPGQHIKGSGCVKCSYVNRGKTKKNDINDIITKANLVHHNKYDYSKVVYTKNNIKVDIICPIHGLFKQTMNNHIDGGQGCKQCAKIDRANTNLERYGHENIAHGIKKEKVQKTNLEKYGVIHPYLNKDVQEKRRDTFIKKYGVDNPSLSKEIQEKRKQTFITKYNVDNYKQKNMIDILDNINNFDWLFEQYIVLNKTATQIAYELSINLTTICNYLKKSEIVIKRRYRHSFASITWLEHIMTTEQIFIQHAANIGEYKIPNKAYYVDGYCEETKTVYEFHGDYWHGNPSKYPATKINKILNKTMGELYQKTIERENIIKSLGYNLVVMWENDFNKS